MSLQIRQTLSSLGSNLATPLFENASMPKVRQPPSGRAGELTTWVNTPLTLLILQRCCTPVMNTHLTHRLPSPQGVALAIMQACQRDDTALFVNKPLVQADPALTGRLLQLANAAALGARPVVSAQEAVSRMGLQTVQNLALGFSLIDQHGTGDCAGFDYPLFWSQSLLMAVATRDIGNAVRLGAPDELFSFGLLARVGCLALATVYPEPYTAILKEALAPELLLQHERAALATDHLAMACDLHTQWGMPAAFSEAARLHEAPEQARLDANSRPAKMAQVLHLAWQFTNFIVKPERESAQQIAKISKLTEQLGFTPTDFDQLADAIIAAWHALAKQFKIQVQPTAPYSGRVQELGAESLKHNAQAAAAAAPATDSQLRVMVVDDDPVMQQLLQTWLATEPHIAIATANNGMAALTLATTFRPHIILTDWNMPVMDGCAFCKALRASAWGQNIYILMLTGNTSDTEITEAFAAGIDAFLPKPTTPSSLHARMHAAQRFVQLRKSWEQNSEHLTHASNDLAIANRRLEYAARTDPLTELSNRRAGLMALTQAWAAAVRRQQAMSVISLDIDFFKRVNDQHGHDGGDRVLEQVSQILRANARGEDTVCRWGGEEFLLICPNMPQHEALLAAERLRKAIADTPVELGKQTLTVTVSVGLASWRADMTNYEQLLTEADKALYNAKTAGRNRLAQSTDT